MPLTVGGGIRTVDDIRRMLIGSYFISFLTEITEHHFGIDKIFRAAEAYHADFLLAHD